MIFFPDILRRDAVFCFHLFKLNQLAIDCQFECKKHFCLNNVHSMNSNAWMNSTQCMSLRSISYASGCHFVSRWLAQFCCGALSLYIFFFLHDGSFVFTLTITSIRFNKIRSKTTSINETKNHLVIEFLNPFYVYLNRIVCNLWHSIINKFQ